MQTDMAESDALEDRRQARSTVAVRDWLATPAAEVRTKRSVLVKPVFLSAAVNLPQNSSASEKPEPDWPM